MVKVREMPENIHELLTYINGGLYWLVTTSSRIRKGDKAGVLNKHHGYYYVNIKSLGYKLSRIVYYLHYGPIPKGFCIDHINGDTMDNRIENLRLCTHTENMWNRKLHKNNSTGFHGVSFNKANNKYRARVRVNNKVYTKFCLTAEEANQAAVEMRMKYHGEYAMEHRPQVSA